MKRPVRPAPFTTIRMLIWTLLALVAARGSQAQGPGAATFAPDQLVVKMRPAPQATAGAKSARPDSLGKLDKRFGVATRRALRDPPAGGQRPPPPPANPARATAPTVEGIEVLTFGAAVDVKAAAAAYAADPGVLAAEPNYIYRAGSTPNDPLFANQVGDFDQVGFRQAWDVHAGSASILVAVLDSGCDVNHEDLAGAISPVAFDFADFDVDVSDNQGHGTRVCSLIAARGNNGKGMAGGAYGVTLLPLRVVQGDGTIRNSTVIAALDYAVAQGAKVVNMSFTSTSPSALLDASIQAARSSAVLVAAVGNDGRGDQNRYPAAYDGVIGVAASGEGTTAKADFSNFNGNAAITMADLAAPGVSLMSAFPGSQYDAAFGNGTSFAAPLVSAAAALLLSLDPAQSPAGVTQHLLATANPAANTYTNKGLLQTGAALAAPMLPVLSVASVTVDDALAYSGANNADGSLDKGETVKLIATLVNAGADGRTVTATLSESDPLVTVSDSSGAWGTIPSGTSKPATDGFGLTLSASSPAHEIAFTLNISSNAGAYAISLPVTVQANDAQEIADGTLYFSPATWTADKTYVLDGYLTVLSGLTIEPGTSIRLKEHGTIEVVGGAFSAVGTAADPIRFWGMKGGDDYHGKQGDCIWASPAGGGGNSGSFLASLADGGALVASNFALAKFNADGSQAWSRSGAAGGVSARGFAALPDGTSMLVGTSTDPANPVFIGKFDSLGNMVWSKRVAASGSFLTVSGMSVGLFADGSSLVAVDFRGVFVNSITFGQGEVNQTSFASVGAYIAKYNSNGTLAWVKQATGPDYNLWTRVIPFSNGSFLAAGYFSSSLLLGQGEPGQTTLASAGNYDVFVAKYNANGNLAWAKRAGGGGDDYAFGMAAFTDGSFAITGQIQMGPAVFGLGEAGQTTLTATGDSDMFVATFNSNGTLRWAKREGLIYSASGRTVDFFSDGSLLVAGSFDRAIIFNAGGADETSLTPIIPSGSNNDEIYVARYGSDGTFKWATEFGGGGNDGVSGAAALTDGNILVYGQLGGGFALIPGEDHQQSITANGVVAKIRGDSPNWNRLLIRNTAASATINHCILNGGGLRNELASTTVSDSEFTRSLTGGFESAAGTQSVSNCVANHNRHDGLNLGSRDPINCSANNNQGNGILTNGSLTNCAATGNLLRGMAGAGASDCVAIANVGLGIGSSGPVSNSLAKLNGGDGIDCSVGDVIASVAQSNGGMGIICAGGVVSGSLSQFNGGVGMQVSGAGSSTSSFNLAGGITGGSVANCTVEGNTAYGVSGAPVVADSRISGTKSGPALLGVGSVINTSVTDNQNGGIDSVSSVLGAYVAGNRGDGIIGGAISSSSIIGNTGDGVRNPASVSNSWVLQNTGIGIRSNDTGTTVPAVSFSTISGNLSGGIQDVGPSGAANSNILNNSIFEAKDTQARTGFQTKAFEGNYWGPVLTPWMTANPFPGGNRSPEIVDGFDGPSAWFLDYTPHALSPVANAPDSTPPAFLLSVSPEISTPLAAEVATFTLTFSEPMDVLTTTTVVSFDLAAPYNKNVIVPDPAGFHGWIDSVTWRGTFAIDLTTGDGPQTLRVSGAKAADGFVIPDDTYHKFAIDTSGATVANNGIATTIGNNRVRVQASGGGAGTAGFNVTRSQSGEPGTYAQVNESLIPDSGIITFDDTALNSGTTYRWMIYRVSTNGDSVPWAGPLSATTTGPSPTPSPTSGGTATPFPTPRGNAAGEWNQYE